MQGNVHHTIFYRELKTIVLTVLDPEFGSLDPVRLEELANALLGVAATEAHLLVLDLQHVGSFGAAFLGVLVRVHHGLRIRGKHVLICGDEAGIVTRVKLDRLIPVFDAVDDAIAYCRRYVDTTVLPSPPHNVVKLQSNGSLSRKSSPCAPPHIPLGTDSQKARRQRSIESN